MKRINFFVIFLLLPIIIFCFSSNTFAASHGGKKFPDSPEDLDWDNVVAIIYKSNYDRYHLYSASSVSFGAKYPGYSDSVTAIKFTGNVKEYIWEPESSNSWEYYYTFTGGLSIDYILGEDGKYYDIPGNEYVLLYSNTNVVGDEGYDFFFQANNISVFYDHAIDLYSDYLEDDESSWWNIWDSIGNFWDSISSFLGTALSPLFSIMETIGDIFEGFVEALRDIYDTITDFFTNFGSKLIDVFKSLFIPEEGFLEDNLNDIKDTFYGKFGVAIEMKDSILDAFDQVVANEFAGVKINFNNSFLPISGEYYIIDPGPINQYGDRVKPWISGLMILFTVTYILNSVVTIIRGRGGKK